MLIDENHTKEVNDAQLEYITLLIEMQQARLQDNIANHVTTCKRIVCPHIMDTIDKENTKLAKSIQRIYE